MTDSRVIALSLSDSFGNQHKGAGSGINAKENDKTMRLTAHHDGSLGRPLVMCMFMDMKPKSYRQAGLSQTESWDARASQSLISTHWRQWTHHISPAISSAVS